MTLSILCITKAEPHAESFLKETALLAHDLRAEIVFAIDVGANETKAVPFIFPGYQVRWFKITSKGYIESVLDPMLAVCTGDYILRLDDDERVSPAMAEWLKTKEYEAADHWAFPRVNLWKRDDDSIGYITNPPLWPDLQTRLSVKAKAGGRTQIHQGSPYGTGQVAPVHIEHHLFLVKSEAERIDKAAHYEIMQPGAGSGHYLTFSVPEVALPEMHVGSLTALERYGVLA